MAKLQNKNPKRCFVQVLCLGFMLMCASVVAIANPGKQSNGIVFEKQDSVVRQKTGAVVDDNVLSGTQDQPTSPKLNTSSAVQDSLPVVSAIDGTEEEQNEV